MSLLLLPAFRPFDPFSIKHSKGKPYLRVEASSVVEAGGCSAGLPVDRLSVQSKASIPFPRLMPQIQSTVTMMMWSYNQRCLIHQAMKFSVLWRLIRIGDNQKRRCERCLIVVLLKLEFLTWRRNGVGQPCRHLCYQLWLY